MNTTTVTKFGGKFTTHLLVCDDMVDANFEYQEGMLEFGSMLLSALVPMAASITKIVNEKKCGCGYCKSAFRIAEGVTALIEREEALTKGQIS